MLVVSTDISILHNNSYFYLMFGDVKSDYCYKMWPLWGLQPTESDEICKCSI